MDQDLITDITLDHLPDLSEDSVSFQIPYNNASADLLLADHTDGLDLLCDDHDDDVSFAPIAPAHPRGPHLTLGGLTPRVQRVRGTPRPLHRSRSPTPTRLPSPSAKPSVIHRTLTLGHRSSDKTPSRAKSIRRPLESPLVSSERFDQLRAEVETLGRLDESPSHVHVRAVGSAEDGSGECSSSSHAVSSEKDNLPDDMPTSEDLLAPIPEEKDVPLQDVEPPANQDVVMDTGDSCPADATNIGVAGPPPKSKRNPRTSTKPTVVAGGISKRSTHVSKMSKKTKDKPSRVREAQPVPTSAVRQPTPPQSIDAEEGLAPPACMRGDVDSRPENTPITNSGTGGLAERLVSYSQKLISSIGLYKPWPESSPMEASDDVVRVADSRDEARPQGPVMPPSLPPRCINDDPRTHSEALRLSEISPHKHPHNARTPSSTANAEAPQDGRQHAMSPMRSATKRVGTDADRPEEEHRRKRGKTMPTHADSVRGSSNEVVSQCQPGQAKAQEGRPVTHPETGEGTLPSDARRPSLPTARTKYRPKLTSSSQCKGPTLYVLPYLSSSRQVHERNTRKRDERRSKSGSESLSTSGGSASTRVREDKWRRGEKATEGRAGSGPTSTADLRLIEKQRDATLSVARLTKPVGFTFRVDARLEARKAEERLAQSEPGKTRGDDGVPEAKAQRASHSAGMVFGRDGVVPSVPVEPFFFCTEQRAKEREKFDGMVKRKEEEMQRLREEQRRCEAEEEERAIKEMRRRAIPKANEMPDWYADMPKRKGTAVGTSTAA